MSDGVLRRRVAGADAAPSYFELLLHPPASLGATDELNLAQAVLLRQVTSWLEHAAETMPRSLTSRRPDLIAVNDDGTSLVMELKGYPSDAPRWREAWRERGSKLGSHFERVREYVGRVRDIDRNNDTFTAVLGGREADPENEVLGTFERRLVGDRGFAMLEPGSTFTLVTGYRIHLAPDGSVDSSSLDTKFILHQPRPRSRQRIEAAQAEASDLLED